MPFEARFTSGTCAVCDEPINHGQVVDWDADGDLCHQRCLQGGTHIERPPCRSCHLVHAGECF